VEPKLSLGNARAVRSLDDLLRKSDIITLHVPGGAGTRNLLNEARFSKMKKGAALINYSRGDVIDLDALAKAVRSGRILGAAVDVFPHEPKNNKEPFASPLQGLANVILTPHIGGSTHEAQESIGLDVAGKLVQYLETGTSVGSLSVPPLTLPVQQDTHRILHIHANKPGVLGEINSKLSKLNVNILGQYLQTNERIGYVVTDMDKRTSSKALEELKKVRHTIRVRNLY
jgi:D-3-phosphoglycerate dehydrogenase